MNMFDPIDQTAPLMWTENPVVRWTLGACAVLFIAIVLSWMFNHDGFTLFGLFPGMMMMSIGMLLYTLPAAIAHRQHHHNATAITVLNLLLGWTVLGWVISIVWALSKRPGR